MEKQSKIKNEYYYQVSGWMLNELHLKGSELAIFAIVFGFSQNHENEKQLYTGSLQYLGDWTGITKPGVKKCLDALVAKKYIFKKEYYIKGIKMCDYGAYPLTEIRTRASVKEKEGVALVVEPEESTNPVNETVCDGGVHSSERHKPELTVCTTENRVFTPVNGGIHSSERGCSLQLTNNKEDNKEDNKENNKVCKEKRPHAVYPFLTVEEYESLEQTYGNKLLEKTIKRAQQYKGCAIYSTIKAWCKEPKEVTTAHGGNKGERNYGRHYSDAEVCLLEKQLLGIS